MNSGHVVICYNKNYKRELHTNIGAAIVTSGSRSVWCELATHHFVNSAALTLFQ